MITTESSNATLDRTESITPITDAKHVEHMEEKGQTNKTRYQKQKNTRNKQFKFTVSLDHPVAL